MEDVGLYFSFAEVARLESFTAAARSLSVSKATISKQVTQLEETLGVRLLHRTTRKLSLTAEGEALYARCRRMADELEAAKAEVMRVRGKPRGRLRVSVPMSFGLLHIAPAVPEFLERYPEIELDLQLDDRLVDLVQQGFDTAIRIATLPDSSLLARKLATSGRALCATPEYLRRHGTPRSPEDLRRHQCVQYTYLGSGNAWRLNGPEGEFSIPARGPFQANSSLALKHAVLAHVGLGLFPVFHVHEELKNGRLVSVLDDYALPELTIWAVQPRGRAVSLKVRAWSDFLARRFAQAPPWRRSGPEW